MSNLNLALSEMACVPASLNTPPKVGVVSGEEAVMVTVHLMWDRGFTLASKPEPTTVHGGLLGDVEWAGDSPEVGRDRLIIVPMAGGSFAMDFFESPTRGLLLSGFGIQLGEGVAPPMAPELERLLGHEVGALIAADIEDPPNRHDEALIPDDDLLAECQAAWKSLVEAYESGALRPLPASAGQQEVIERLADFEPPGAAERLLEMMQQRAAERERGENT